MSRWFERAACSRFSTFLSSRHTNLGKNLAAHLKFLTRLKGHKTILFYTLSVTYQYLTSHLKEAYSTQVENHCWSKHITNSTDNTYTTPSQTTEPKFAWMWGKKRLNFLPRENNLSLQKFCWRSNSITLLNEDFLVERKIISFSHFEEKKKFDPVFVVVYSLNN